MTVTNHERRRAERLLLAPPLYATVAGHPVTVHEIGLFGSRVESEVPIVGSDREKLTMVWEGEEITVDCSIAHSEKLHVDGKGDRFMSGLRFEIAEPPALRRMITTIAAHEEVERLKTIVEASKLINSSIEPGALLESILSVARNELGVERGTLYFVDQKKGEIWSKIADGLHVTEIRLPIGKGLAGTVAETGEPVILYDAYADPRFDPSQDQRSGFRTRSMLCVPIRNREQRIVGVLQLLNKKNGSFGAHDLEFLAAISEHMAIAMENATLHMAVVEKNRMERELQLGREIQSRLLPSPPIDVFDTQIAAASVPCYEVGGDYYDFIEFADGDLGLALGDVSGKGVSAAMIMSSIQAALRIAAPIEEDLAELMSRLNRLLCRMAGGRKYVTFFFGRYSPETGELHYVNAGHNPPLIVANGRIEEVPSTGKPIGLMPDATYDEGAVLIPKGGTLYLYTDGLNEAADPDENEFGMDRLRELAIRAAADEVSAITPRILTEIAQFERGAHATDDKTIVVVRRSRDAT
ncbi:MAG TPA: GAF domain-containing SpoIIE family protein phosphatase [Thermoanaerobaculia bacterium]|nr:GAF domain-containing SpoIIE family protein phosphatase [Thermoanaerobaculia bacterium]